MSHQTPPWPSLYDLSVELVHIAHRDPIQPGGRYLHDPHEIFLFTLYWNLILHAPIFAFCGLYAFLNFIFPHGKQYSTSHPLLSINTASPEVIDPNQPSHIVRQSTPRISPPKHNPNRTRVTFAIIVLVLFLSAGVLSATLGSAIVGYILVGLFKAAKFQMSTWIPFLFALSQTIISLLGAWSSVFEFI